MKKIKYIILSMLAFSFIACENEELEELRDLNSEDEIIILPELTAGTADFSTHVALGPSFTAGFTDGGLFIAAQENSFPNLISKQFANAGGGLFTQPLMSDNFGGLALNGARIASPRLVFGGAGPAPLESIIGPVTIGTDIVLNNPTGPFNNLGVPGAKSFHLIAPGYGNIANLPNANPYAVRLTGNTPNATLLELAVVQDPTFFTLGVIGGNDVLGYATSGGDGSNPITDSATFDTAMTALINGLVSTGAKGALGNTPDLSNLPFFTTIPFNPLDPTDSAFGPLIPTLNGIFGQINQVFAFLNVPERSIVFSETVSSAVVIQDESLADLSVQITGVLNASPTFPAFVESFGLPAEAAPLVANLLGNTYGQARQANETDLLTLPSAAVIGTVNEDSVEFLMNQGLPEALAGQFSVEGISLPLADRWILLSGEQQEVATATAAHNATLASLANANGLALVDLNAILDEAASTGIIFDDYNLNTDLVFGGLVSLDGIHLTGRGYAYMANKYLEKIDEIYGSNFVASGNVAKANDYPTNYSPLLQ